MDPASTTPQMPPLTKTEAEDVSTPIEQKKLPIKGIVIGIAIVLFLAIISVIAWVFIQNGNEEVEESDQQASEESTKKQLVYLVHWTWEEQLDGLKKYLNEYTALHPDITFDVKVVPYAEYPDKLELFHETDTPADIYQIYSTWGVELVENGVLDTPPDSVIADVKSNYLSTAGATINGEVWGIPSEINDYALIYDKKVFRDAGLVDVEMIDNWDDLITKAKQITVSGSDGVITRYGIVFGQGEDWGVVDPFLSLLWSNNGDYLAEDFSESLVNSPEAIEALEKLDSLYEQGVTDINGNIFDFGKGNIGMVIAPPWLEATFKENFGDRFETDLGVMPLPKIKTQTSLQYNWFVGVMEKSQNKQESWDFLSWFTSDIQEATGTTRYGDLLADVIGAIPARKVDVENHKESLNSIYKKVFVEQLDNSTPEPNVLNSARIKNILMDEISAVWVDEKTAQEALNNAKVEIDKILKENY